MAHKIWRNSLSCYKIPLLLCFAAVIAIISVQPLFAEGIPKIGKNCPNDYHLDGTSVYCIPFDGKTAARMVPKNGKTCPAGYHSDGENSYYTPF